MTTNLKNSVFLFLFNLSFLSNSHTSNKKTINFYRCVISKVKLPLFYNTDKNNPRNIRRQIINNKNNWS